MTGNSSWIIRNLYWTQGRNTQSAASGLPNRKNMTEHIGNFRFFRFQIEAESTRTVRIHRFELGLEREIAI